MLKRMINHATVDLTITPIDPMLIKSGQATVGGVDMAFVRTYSRNSGPEPFIPGSSLKGVIRSYSEKICRSLRENPVPVCLPYLKPGEETNDTRGQAACGLRLTKNIPTADVYRISCPACRLFGSHYFCGRLETSDGYLTEEFKKTGKPVLETRDGVAIDRLTGGPAGGAKYDLEVLTKGEFGTRLEIRNFERWQLGLLGLTLRDMEAGLIRIGMGKSRGLGRFRAAINRFEISSFGAPLPTLKGLGALCSEEERRLYGFFTETDPGVSLPAPQPDGLRFVYDLTPNWKAALEAATQDLARYVTQVSWPQAIDDYPERRRS